jgi:hypothetical protein
MSATAGPAISPPSSKDHPTAWHQLTARHEIPLKSADTPAGPGMLCSDQLVPRHACATAPPAALHTVMNVHDTLFG